MPASSLARRLFITATGVSAAILIVVGVLLSTLYRGSLERSFDRRLNVYLKTIVADVALASKGALPEPVALGEPLFEQPLSGWYWQILRFTGDKVEVKASRSVPEAGLPILSDVNLVEGLGGFREGYVAGPEGQKLRVVERIVDLGEDGRYLVAVAGDAYEIDDDSDDFNDALFVTFALLGVAFVLTVGFQVRFGLRPLRRISDALNAVRSGRTERLEGTFPEEIAPLAREVNALLESNREIVDRARMHVGNLAHALKTPLSVLLNEAAGRGDPAADKVREQVSVMREQVQHHLERARLAARVAVVGTVSEVPPVVEALARTMPKIHHDRGLTIETRGIEDVKFSGERQDFEEMLGNLVDNACKWANSRIEIEVFAEHLENPADRAFFHVLIDDDGPGLSLDAREQLPSRGRKLDENKPGSGLGLSIVADLATLYGGKLILGTAPIGGLRAELVLPAAEA
ncbi:MAG TPA: ATP-binding protein [Xanthobacteraceae bacterium]|nr:ATP-binding protein [Xanthobacteraceae bacterium]